MRKPYFLLVEDNSDDVELMQHACRKTGLGCALLVVNDGNEALDFMFAKGDFADHDVTHLPRLILMDLKMPEVSGDKVLKILRSDKRTSTVPIVIFSCSNEESDIKQCYANGANDYIQKPVDFKEFVSVVQQLGEHWLDADVADMNMKQ